VKKIRLNGQTTILENQITVAYDTMWNGTRRMAEAIAHGIAAAIQM